MNLEKMAQELADKHFPDLNVQVFGEAWVDGKRECLARDIRAALEKVTEKHNEKHLTVIRVAGSALKSESAIVEQQAERIQVAEELSEAAENLLKHIEIIAYPRKGGLSIMRMLADRLAKSNEEFQKA